MKHFKELITKPFEDWRKLLVAVTLLAVPLLNFITFLFVYGYMILYSSSVQKGWDSLPDWKNFGKLLKLGLKGFLLNLTVLFPSIILTIVLYLALGVGIDGAGSIVFLAPDWAIYMIFSVLILVLVISLYIMPAMQLRYAKNLRLRDAFEMDEVLRLCFSPRYFIDTLYISVISFLAFLIALLFSYFLDFTYVLPFIFTALAEFFSMVVYFKLFSELARDQKRR
jgi:hypothetical protein